MTGHRDAQAGIAREGSDGGRGGTVEAYEDGGAVVFYDAENPLAWMEAARTVSLDDRV